MAVSVALSAAVRVFVGVCLLIASLVLCCVCLSVLIQGKSKQLLPEWLRFVKGIVDSEDVPLNVSRENMQESPMIKRLNGVITKRIIKFIEDQAKNDPETYAKWFAEFGEYL